MGNESIDAHFSTLSIHSGSSLRQADGAEDGAAGAFGMPEQDRLPTRAPDPILAVLEERVAALEEGSAAVAFPSIEIARLVALEALLHPGDEIVVAHDYPKGSSMRLDEYCSTFGWQIRRAFPDQPETFVEALSDRSKAILIESVADHAGGFTDIEAIARVAKRARIPLIVDNTLATPYLVRPFEHGADVVLHDARPFLGGFKGADAAFVVDGGAFDWTDDARYPKITGPIRHLGGRALSDLVGNFAFATGCRMLGMQSLGTAMAATAPYAVLHGIETLSLRMQRHCDNAFAAARYLERHPAVHWVRYAGLESDRGHPIALRYSPHGAGALLSFALADDAVARRFAMALKLFSISEDFGGSRSVVLLPSTPSQRESVRREDLHATVRLAIGLEDVDDIFADLAQALAA